MIGNHNPEPQLRSRRIPFQRPVRVAPRSGEECRSEESFDLSLGGMFVTSLLPLEVGEVVDVELPLDTIRFTTPAMVSWTRTFAASEEQPTGMAVRFIGLNQHQKRLIHRQVTNHTRSGGKLKVGRPPASDRGPKPTATTRSPSAGGSFFDSPLGWWLVAAAGAAFVVTLLLAILF